MRSFRVFNNIDRVDVEWMILGLRWRLPAMVALISTIFAGLIVYMVSNAWVAVPVGLILAFGVLHVVRWINGMDPQGVLHEFTQLGLILRTTRRPVINNTGRR